MNTGRQTKRSENNASNVRKNRSRRRRGRRGGVPVPQASNNRMIPRMNISTHKAGVKVAYSELWGSVSQGINTFVMRPGRAHLPKLDLLAQGWEMYVLESARVRYQTGVGTTKDGNFVMGVDYNTATLPTTREGVYALDPRTEGPVWENRVINVNAARAMSKKAMSCNSDDPDDQAFSVSAWSDVDQSGIVFVDYCVYLYGPVKASGGDAEGKVLASVVATNETVNGQVVGDVVATESDATSDTETLVTGDSDLNLKTVLVDGGRVGDELVTSTAGPISANSTLRVSFKDQATGQDLVASGVIVPKATRYNAPRGIISTIWSFVKPWIRPIALTLVDKLTSGNGEPSSEQNWLLVTDKEPVIVTLPAQPDPIGTVAVALYSGNSSFISVQGIPSWAFQAGALGGGTYPVFLTFMANADYKDITIRIDWVGDMRKNTGKDCPVVLEYPGSVQPVVDKVIVTPAGNAVKGVVTIGFGVIRYASLPKGCSIALRYNHETQAQRDDFRAAASLLVLNSTTQEIATSGVGRTEAGLHAVSNYFTEGTDGPSRPPRRLP